MKRMKILCMILSICMLFSSCGFAEKKENIEISAGELTVKFLDVAQGDCELIILPDETVILIDGGDTFCSDTIVSYLKSQGVEEIDYIVATHPHADHIGGLDDVLNSFSVEKIVLPEISKRDIPSTVAYEKFLRAITLNGCETIKAKGSVPIFEAENIKIDCLGPISANYGDLNEYSAIIKLQYGEISFLFMGDATEDNEEELLKVGAPIDVDVLKVGHHGSSTSSSAEFLDEATPQYAVISTGEENRYGHPHYEAMKRFNERDVKTYITKDDGTIVMKSNGETISITTSEDKLYS